MTSANNYFKATQEMRRTINPEVVEEQIKRNYFAAHAAVGNEIRAPVFIDDAIERALTIVFHLGELISKTNLKHDALIVDAYESMVADTAKFAQAGVSQLPHTEKIPLINDVFEMLSNIGYIAAVEHNAELGSMSSKLWALGDFMANDVEILPYSIN